MVVEEVGAIHAGRCLSGGRGVGSVVVGQEVGELFDGPMGEGQGGDVGFAG